MNYKTVYQSFILSLLIFCFIQLSFSDWSDAQNVDAAFRPQDSTYTIAFLLPFNNGKIFIRNLENSDFYFPGESQTSIEYYQGALLAVDSLVKQGMNMRLLTYDVGNDTATVNAILNKPILKTANLIIGPLNGYALKATAEYSAREHIPLLSPLSATSIPSDPNQFYILANATMRTHCEQIYEYLLQHDLTHRIILLYRNRDEDLELLKYFREYSAKKIAQENRPLIFTELNDSLRKNHARLQDSLFRTNKNIVIVLSNSETFVRGVLKQVADIKADYDIQVVGMPTWLNFDMVPEDFFDSSKVIITSSYFLDKSSVNAINFKNSYTNKFKVNPSEYAVLGYDEMFYFGSHLQQLGARLFLSVFPSAMGLTSATSFKVVPVMQQEREVMYRENKSLFFLHRDGGTWIKMDR